MYQASSTHTHTTHLVALGVALVVALVVALFLEALCLEVLFLVVLAAGPLVGLVVDHAQADPWAL